jgi:hypothetical protein
MWFACSRVRPPHPQPLSPKGGEGRKKEFRMVGRGEREGIQDAGARGERRNSGCWGEGREKGILFGGQGRDGCARRGALVARTMNSGESGNGRDGGLNFLKSSGPESRG